MTILSNDWWAMVWNTYSMTIVGIPTAITFALKLWAIFNPNIPTDKITGLFKDLLAYRKKIIPIGLSYGPLNLRVKVTRG